jgi:Inner membrane component of T3SS, cytoplasmic domain
MLSKSGEVPERCCVNAAQFAERSPSAFLSSSLSQDHKVPSRPQVWRATSPHAGPDFDSTRSSGKPSAHEFPEIPPHEDIAITISVIEGPSKGLTYRLSKVRITMGRIGGGADFEFDEPEASDVHCVIAARQDGVRLYVAPTVNNIYVNDQRIYTVELVHMSTFRVGSSLLLVRVLPTQCADIG